MLNEIAKMRNMMGLNEGRSISGVYYDTTIMHELESVVGDLHKIAPYVLDIGHRVYGNIDGGISVYEESTLVKKFKSVEDFLRGIRYGAQKIENESTNGEMGYNPSPLGEELSDETMDHDVDTVRISLVVMSKLSDIQVENPELRDRINSIKALIMKMNDRTEIPTSEIN